MGQIIKQPNGKYCVFSTVVDNITDYDMSIDDIVDKWTKQYREEIIEKINSIVTKLENDEKPYYQFTMSFDEMLETIKGIYGEEESNEINKLCQIE